MEWCSCTTQWLYGLPEDFGQQIDSSTAGKEGKGLHNRLAEDINRVFHLTDKVMG